MDQLWPDITAYTEGGVDTLLRQNYRHDCYEWESDLKV